MSKVRDKHHVRLGPGPPPLAVGAAFGRRRRPHDHASGPYRTIVSNWRTRGGWAAHPVKIGDISGAGPAPPAPGRFIAFGWAFGTRLKAIAVDECSSQSMPSTGVPNTNDGASEAKTGASVTAAQSATTPRAGTAPRRGTKIARVVELLQRDQGANLDELIAATGWLPHTARAALTGLRHRGYDVRLERGETGRASVYRAAVLLATAS